MIYYMSGVRGIHSLTQSLTHANNTADMVYNRTPCWRPIACPQAVRLRRRGSCVLYKNNLQLRACIQLQHCH